MDFKTTKKFREMYKMSQRDFADYFSVPYGTVKNWDARNCAPEYFINLCYRFMNLKKGGADYDEKGNFKEFNKSD